MQIRHVNTVIFLREVGAGGWLELTVGNLGLDPRCLEEHSLNQVAVGGPLCKYNVENDKVR